MAGLRGALLNSLALIPVSDHPENWALLLHPTLFLDSF